MEEVRRLAPPAPPHDWSQLMGTIDAVAWRAAVAATPDAERVALLALLDIWADQPFARAGSRWWVGRATAGELDRLREGGTAVASAVVRDGGTECWFVAAASADPEGDPVPAAVAQARPVRVERDDDARLRALVAAVEAHGPVPVPESAAARFAELTGVRRAVARLVAAGLVGRPHPEEDRALVRGAPYRATPMTAKSYDGLRERLGGAGRRAVLAAALPADPAGLWLPGGVEAAVERMAGVWQELVGTLPAVHDEAADALEGDLGLPEVWARRLAGGYGAAADATVEATGLAAPTDRNVRRWNGWSAKRHAGVRAELLGTGAVVEAKRARAGRTLFLPGEWTELKSPHLPLETAKLAAHAVRPMWSNAVRSPFGRILATAPLHEMFTAAWERLQGGEAAAG
ncbi:hypothetical protein OG264_03475 [Streptomyces xanthophaeus]|uniref:hypothetical protein n=1 Tax=Streptomyces xanthophaeus TaxID=67385 RepID=UPI00386ED5D9|nr:hypothetical protein OG264_03475 [Streptomyces xanthophaeus]WST64371.1 hypothetical protein OG605_34885 [Streptomyces xanthophaeus]